MGALNPKRMMDAATSVTAGSLWRGFWSHGFSDDRGTHSAAGSSGGEFPSRVRVITGDLGWWGIPWGIPLFFDVWGEKNDG